MNIFNKLLKITTGISIVIIFIFFSTLEAKNLDKFSKGDNIASYFSGIIFLNQSNYTDSFNHFKQLDGLEDTHPAFAQKYIYTLVNSGNFNQAFKYANKIEKENKDSFESNLIMGIHYLKNSKYELSNSYFLKANKRSSNTILNSYIAESLLLWSNLKNNELEKALIKLNQLDARFENLKKIQNVFIHCFFGSKISSSFFYELVSDQKTDFSRYNYFYAKYLNSVGKNNEAKNILETALEKHPRNLLLNQYKIDLENMENSFNFDCKKRKDVVAELLYIAANALSSQSIYQLSNFYLNLSKYLNKDFHAFDTLLAENFYKIDDFVRSKRIYKNLIGRGNSFKWYANKQISRILIKEEKKAESIQLLKESYDDLFIKGVYETYDYAEFLKNNEEFNLAIKYYTKILNIIETDHPLFPEVADGRGVAYERIGEWEKAEKDLLASLQASPDQAYVINYLAYSWIEQGIKIEKSLKMLERANELKSNDPYIIDSLGWALFKLERFEESKHYLQKAVSLMPADPIVNDHYGDVLWKNGNKIQARYYWNYVMNLEVVEKDLKDKIQIKLIKGL